MKLETKYNIGDKVYFMLDNNIYSGIVEHIQVDKIYSDDNYDVTYYLQYNEKNGSRKSHETEEENLFPTDDDLLLQLKMDLVEYVYVKEY